jgi:hypothetical protein
VLKNAYKSLGKKTRREERSLDIEWRVMFPGSVGNSVRVWAEFIKTQGPIYRMLWITE